MLRRAGLAPVQFETIHPHLDGNGPIGCLQISHLLDTTRPTAAKAVTTLMETGMLAEIFGKRRDRSFGYTAYLDLLKAETAPL